MIPLLDAAYSAGYAVGYAIGYAVAVLAFPVAFVAAAWFIRGRFRARRHASSALPAAQGDGARTATMKVTLPTQRLTVKLRPEDRGTAQQRLTVLAAMRDKGMLTQQQYEQLRSQEQA